MAAKISIPHKIKSLAVLQDSRDVDEFENSFISSIVRQTEGGDKIKSLSQIQTAFIQRLYAKNFIRTPSAIT